MAGPQQNSPDNLPKKPDIWAFIFTLVYVTILVGILNGAITYGYLYYGAGEYETLAKQTLCADAICSDKRFPLFFFVAVVAAQLLTNMWPMKRLHDHSILFFSSLESTKYLADEINVHGEPGEEERKKWATEIISFNPWRKWWANSLQLGFSFLILLGIGWPWMLIAMGMPWGWPLMQGPAQRSQLDFWQAAFILAMIGIPFLQDFLEVIVRMFKTGWASFATSRLTMTLQRKVGKTE